MTLTLSVLWRKYISQLRVERGVVENTVDAYETGWNSFSACARALGWRLKVAEDLTYERLVEWQLNQKEVGRKEWTCRTYLMALKGFSRWLNVNGHLRTDPGARFKTPRLKRVIPVLPPFAELEAKLVAEPSLRNRAIIAIALYGGTRAEEIQDIKTGNFVADQGLIGFVGKGGKQRSVALPAKALKIVSEYLASNGSTLRASDPLISQGGWERRGAQLLRDQPRGHPVDEAPPGCATHAPQASPRLRPAVRGSGRGQPRHRRSARTRIPGVHQDLHAGVVPAHPSHRRVI